MGSARNTSTSDEMMARVTRPARLSRRPIMPHPGSARRRSRS
jgi:hypothetical protein